jgi:TATA-binding protein-associated factor Taf7
MARGWESKSVADQIEEGHQRVPEHAPELDLSPEARLHRQHLESLKLSRSRTLAQLDRATSPAYRVMLEKALRKLEQEIEENSRLFQKTQQN